VLYEVEGLFSPGSPVAIASQPASPVHSQVQVHGDSSPVITFATQAGLASQVSNLTQKRKVAAIQSEDPERRQSGTETLLSLLGKAKKNSVPVHQDTSEAHLLPSASATTSPPKQSVLSEAPHDKVLGMTSKLEAKANSQRTSSQSAPSSNSNKFPPVASEDKIDVGINVAASDDSEKENSQESAKKGNESAIKSAAEIVAPAAELKQRSGTPSPKPKATQFVDQFLNGDIFEGMKRVPRKYVRISNAQQNLLERNDAWFDPSTDPKKRYALIPAKLHEELTVFINQKQVLDFGNQIEESDSESDGSESGSDSEVEAQEGHVEDGEDEFGDDERQENLRTASKRFGDEMSDEEHITWSPSPERDLLRNVPQNIDPQRSSSPMQRDTGAKITDDEFDRATGFVDGDARPASLPVLVHGGHQQNLPPREKRKLPVMLSSSPSPEDELELDELHAVGDEIEDDSLEAEQVPETSQEIPSTSLQNQRLVQVERTPDVKVHDNLHVEFSSNPAGLSPKRARDGPTSSHFEETISATCEDSTPRFPKTIPSSIESRSSMNVNGRLKSIPSQLSNPENVQIVIPDDDLDADENTMMQQQVVTEFQNSQPQSSESITSSPIKPSLPAMNTEQSSVTKSKRNSTSPPKSSPPKRSPQIISSSPVQKADARKPSNSEMPTVSAQSLKRSNDVLGSKKRQLPVKRRRYSSAAAAIQLEDGFLRDTKEMARALRHSHISGGGMEGSTSLGKASKSVGLNALDSTAGSPQLPRGTAQFSPQSSPVAGHPESTTQEPPTANPEQQKSVSVEPRMDNSGQSNSGDDEDDPTPKEVESVEAVASTDSISKIYTDFKAAYPNYAGSQGEFTWSLVYIEWLTRERKLLPHSLLDDFIRVNASEYLVYVRQPRSSDEDVQTGYEFYNQNAEQGIFTKSLIKYDNLQEALLSLDQDRVEKYRNNFNQPRAPKMSTLQNEEAMAPEQPQQAPAEQSREVMVVESPVHQNVASPELGSTKHHRSAPKKPFFETFSQMPSANPRDASVAESPVGECLDTPTKSKGSGRRRTLPWQQNTSSPLSNPAPSSGIKRKRPSPSPSPMNRYKSHKSSARARPTSHREASSPSPPNRHKNVKSSINARSSPNRGEEGSASSPILGSVPEPASTSTTKKKTAQAASPPSTSTTRKRTPQAPSSPFQPPSLSAFRDASSSSKSVDDVNKVKGWLDTQPEPQTPQPKKVSRFKAFLMKRRQSGELVSRNSTPGSAKGRGICTNPKVQTPGLDFS
jgi:hypothetical protein